MQADAFKYPFKWQSAHMLKRLDIVRLLKNPLRFSDHIHNSLIRFEKAYQAV